MSGYVEGVLVLLAINVVLAYAAFLPMAAGQLNLGVAGFAAIGGYMSAFISNNSGHYKPSKDRLLKFVRELWRYGLADDDGTKVICLGGKDFEGALQNFFDNFATL